MTSKEMAKKVIINNLDSIVSKRADVPLEIVNEKFMVQTDDEILLEHIKVLAKIFNNAIEEIEGENKDDNKN